MASASAPRLYDATGTEIPLPGPKAPPIPAPILSGVNADIGDRWRLYPSKQLKPNRIVEILEEADAGDPYRLIELEEEMVEKDGKIEAILKARTSAVQGLNWSVVPPKLRLADQGSEEKAAEIARFSEQALESTEFSELIGDLMDGVGKPFAVDWITWGNDAKGRAVPLCFDRVPTKHLRWSFKTNQLRVFQPSNPGNFTDGDWGEPLPPYQTVRALDQSRRDDPTRAGVLRTLLWPYFFKMLIVKDMVSYGERYGLPPRVLKIDQSDFDNKERYDKFRAAMASWAVDLSAVISKNSDLEMSVVATNDGVKVFIEQIDYFDKWMAWKVLGHELTSQSSPGQGQLGITAAQDVKQEIKEGDCRWLSSIIKRDLLTPMVGWNFGWDAVNAHLVPTLQFDYEPPRDLNVESTVMQRIFQTFPKLTASKQQIRDDYGIAAPVGEEEAGPDDDVLLPGGAAAGAADTNGATGIDSPGKVDDQNPDAEEANAAAAGKIAVTFSEAPASTPVERQKTVDELGRRGTTGAKRTTDGWARQMREIIRQGATDGLNFAQVRARIVEAYPELDVKELDGTLREQILLTRLYGRNGS